MLRISMGRGKRARGGRQRTNRMGSLDPRGTHGPSVEVSGVLGAIMREEKLATSAGARERSVRFAFASWT